MNEVFRLLVHKYVKHLVEVPQAKLRKLRGKDVGQTLCDDAMHLQNVMKDLVRFSSVIRCNTCMNIYIYSNCVLL